MFAFVSLVIGNLGLIFANRSRTLSILQIPAHPQQGAVVDQRRGAVFPGAGAVRSRLAGCVPVRPAAPLGDGTALPGRVDQHPVCREHQDQTTQTVYLF